MSVKLVDSTSVIVTGATSVKEEGSYTCFYSDDNNMVPIAAFRTAEVVYWQKA